MWISILYTSNQSSAIGRDSFFCVMYVKKRIWEFIGFWWLDIKHPVRVCLCRWLTYFQHINAKTNANEHSCHGVYQNLIPRGNFQLNWYFARVSGNESSTFHKCYFLSNSLICLVRWFRKNQTAFRIKLNWSTGNVNENQPKLPFQIVCACVRTVFSIEARKFTEECRKHLMCILIRIKIRLLHNWWHCHDHINGVFGKFSTWMCHMLSFSLSLALSHSHLTSLSPGGNHRIVLKNSLIFFVQNVFKAENFNKMAR